MEAPLVCVASSAGVFTGQDLRKIEPITLFVEVGWTMPALSRWQVLGIIALYRILVPVANPSTQKGLLQLAVVFALSNNTKRLAETPLPVAVVYPLSLIQLEEDYLFQSTPIEADRLIPVRRARLEELIHTLEPPEADTTARDSTLIVSLALELWKACGT